MDSVYVTSTCSKWKADIAFFNIRLPSFTCAQESTANKGASRISTMAEPNQSSPAQLSKRRSAENEERREYPKHTTSQCRGTCIMSLQEFNESSNHPSWRTRLQISDSSMWTFRNDVQHLKLRTRRCLLLRPSSTFMHACKTAGNSRNVLSAVTPQLQISAVYPQAAKVRRVRKVLSLSGQPGFCSYDSCVMFYTPPPVFQSAVIHSLCRFGRTALQYAYFLPDLWTAEKTLLTESSHFQRHLEAWLNA